MVSSLTFHSFHPQFAGMQQDRRKIYRKDSQSTIFFFVVSQKCYKNLLYLDYFGTMPLRKYLSKYLVKLWLFQNSYKLKL